MKQPILAYGHSILKQKCKDINSSFAILSQLITDMWETMYNANGCGLAAPQIGKPIRLFIVDSKTTYENLEEPDRSIYFDEDDEGIKETFINAKILERSKDLWDDDEGCLSIPSLSQKIKRPWSITISYYTLDFQQQTKSFSGLTARMIQHEYDHTEGILFTDYLKPLTRKLIDSKLKQIAKGRIKTKYSMKFI